jgi:hypothetical protein
VVEADDVRLSEGFHAFEADNGIRWTNGAAALSHELLAVMAGAGMLVVVLGGATRYADEGELALVA